MKVALSISSRDVRLVALEGNQVRQWGVAPLAVEQVKDGHILQPEAVGEAISSLFKSLKVSKDDVWLVVNGLPFTYRIINLPRMKSSQMEEAIMRAARKEFALPLEELYLSTKVIGAEGNEVQVFVLGVPHMLIDDIMQTMGFAGIKLAGIDLQSLALARTTQQPDALIVNFEPDCFDITIVARGMPAILRTVTPKTEDEAIEDSVRRLVDELSRTVNFYNITHASTPLPQETPLFLTGSLSHDESTIGLVKQSITYPVEPVAPPVKSAPDFPLAQFVSTIGAAIKGPSRQAVPRAEGTRFYDININLLTEKRRAEAIKTKARGKSRIAVATFVIVLLLLAPVFLLKNQAVTETAKLQAKLDMVSRELRLARLNADEAVVTEANIRELLAKVESLQHERQLTLGTVVDTAVRLRPALDLLTHYGNLLAIEADSETIAIQGLTDSRSKVINYALALEKLKQFAEVRIASIDEESSGSTGGTTNDLRIQFTIMLTK